MEVALFASLIALVSQVAPAEAESALAATTGPAQAPTPEFFSDVIGFGKGLLRFAILLVLIPLAALALSGLFLRRDSFRETSGWLASLLLADVVAVTAIHFVFSFLS